MTKLERKQAIVVGLTGQTGAGKTTVSQTFLENTYYTIDADMVSRMVTAKGTPCLEEVVEHFGNDILDQDGNLIRKKLGDIVFCNRQELQALESITYPYILKQIEKMIVSATTFGADKILLDAPTLFESGAYSMCNKIVSVVSNKELRIRRIIARDGLTKSQAENRVKAQLSEEFFRTHSDYVIENNGTVDELKLNTLSVISKI